jgi:hypothetical protein
MREETGNVVMRRVDDALGDDGPHTAGLRPRWLSDLNSAAAMNHAHLHQVLVHLRAGQWTEAHNLVQCDDSALAAWLHGILHIQEGDLEDAE